MSNLGKNIHKRGLYINTFNLYLSLFIYKVLLFFYLNIRSNKNTIYVLVAVLQQRLTIFAQKPHIHLFAYGVFSWPLLYLSNYLKKA